MTLCGNKDCGHAFDLHDTNGVCSFPDCKCSEFKPMSSMKNADKGLGNWLSKHLGSKKSGRERLEGQ